VVQVIKSLQDPLEVGNNLPGINDNVRERGLERKCSLNADGRLTEAVDTFDRELACNESTQLHTTRLYIG